MKLTIAACAAAIALALGAAGAAQAQSKGEVRLLTYEGYADPAWVKEFQDETGIAVKVTYVGGVDEQIAKMKASNGRDYDVVAVDTASLKAFADQKLVAPIDKLSVVLVALFGVVFLGERPALNGWIGIGLIAAGAVVIALG